MIAYFDCFSGVSGDMLLGAFVDAGVSLDDLRADLSRLPLHNYEITAEKVVKQGLAATLVQVKTGHEHHHRHLGDIVAIIEQADLPVPVKERAKAIFQRLAEAEARVHGTTVAQVHFHEVGAVDAIVDIVGACCCLHRLGIERVTASALPLGGGWVDTEHGRLPVPAPATAALLEGVPSYGGPVEAELVTPTGAAILTTICESFGPMPPMTIARTACGAGRRDLPHPNVLRLFLGESAAGDPRELQLALIETNLDDMNPELLGYVMERLLEAGARDVYYTPIVMKKSRPATLVSVLCEPAQVDALSGLLFRETTTLGLRVSTVLRRCLAREWREVQTEYGAVRVKLGLLDGEVINAAPEYEDCARLAREKGVPAKAVYEAARKAV